VLAEAFLRSGKVRDLYELPDARLVLVATDRISAFDVVLPTPIPDKGRVLTGLSRYWFAKTASLVRNHLLATDPAEIAAAFAEALTTRGAALVDLGSVEDLRGRLMICRPTSVLPIEAVVRGYLAGSGWREYRETGRVCGVALPSGLREGDRLPQPIFTPATKAPAGAHDENIDFDTMVDHLAREMTLPTAVADALATHVREASLSVYRYGHAMAEQAGILVADTKFEWGLAVTGDDVEPGPVETLVTLIDELLTPDSSRFWDAATWNPGGPQPSYDKQFVRDWLDRQPWPRTEPAPELPDDVVAGTRERYVAAFERITGASFDRYLQEDVIGQ
jgi:phosphoribosylaminoimidazole-succinocarboxamide synthase